MSHRRTWGRRLLVLVARLTPEGERSWADAMRGEFEAIESDGEALQWSVGSAFTLLRVSMAAAFRAEWERGMTMSRVFVVVSVLVFGVLWVATPVVRQGVSLVFETWSTGTYAPMNPITHRDVEGVRADQRRQNDPEALAYLALNESDPSQADYLAAKAVEKDPKLGWVYGVLAKAHQGNQQTRLWIQKLRNYDANNALASLIAAREIRSQRGDVQGSRAILFDPEWVAQMKQAFAAPVYNDYMRERMDLQRAIMRRYEVGSPISLLAVIYRMQPLLDINPYADKLILEGNRTGDLSKYREIIGFAQRLYLGASTDLEQNVAKNLLSRAMRILGPKLMAQGRSDEAAQMAFQVAAIQNDIKSSIENRSEELLVRTAGVIHLATFFALVSTLAMVCSAVAWSIARFRRTSLRALPAIMTGCVMVLMSSLAIVYVSYRPYEQIYRWFMNGGYVPPKTLASFASIVNVPFLLFSMKPSFSSQVLFWQVVFVAGILALAGIALRHFPVWRRGEAR